MKKIYRAKMIVTMDASHPFATHVAVDDVRIVGLGDLELVKALSNIPLDRSFSDFVGR